MNIKTTSKKSGVVTRFLWFVAGADTETLSQCPLDHKKFEAIGLTILMTALVGFAAGCSAAWYFTENGFWTLLFGAFWSLLIFSIDRSLVVTLKKDPYKKSYYILPILARSVLAILVAGIMSIPLELLVFNGFIQNDIENYKSDLKKQQKEDSFDQQQASEYDTRSGDLQNESTKNQNNIDDIDTQLNRLKGEKANELRKLNNPSSEAYFDYKRKLDYLYSLPRNDYRRNNIPAIKSHIASQKSIWNRQVRARISELEAEILKLNASKQDAENKQAVIDANKSRIDSISEAYKSKADSSINRTEERLRNGNNFTLYYTVLTHAIYKKHKVSKEIIGANGKKTTLEKEEFENADFLFLLWFIRVMFFIIELLPSIVKIASKSGQYELRIYHQENALKSYLESPEYKDYCYQMLAGDHELQIELQKKRQEAEKNIQETIIQSIMKAEKDVAQQNIDKWEQAERAKLQDQDSC